MNVLRTGKILFLLWSIFFTTISAQEFKSNLSRKYENIKTSINTEREYHLNDAVIQSLAGNPVVNQYLLEIKALEKTVIQESLISNPELDIEAENFWGGGEFRGFNASEITASVSQEILLAGKISKRTSIAELKRDLIYYDYELKRLDIITDVRMMFNEIIALQKLLNKQEQILNNISDLSDYIKAHKDKGNASLADISKASIEYKKLLLETSTSRRKLESALRQLAQLTGRTDLDGYEFKSENHIATIIPGFEEIVELLNHNPALAKFSKIKKLDDENISYQEALAVPDLSITAGIRRINEVGENAFVLGLSVPIPLFNNNSAGIEEAVIRKEQRRSEYESEKLKLMQEIAVLYYAAIDYQLIINTINNSLLADAEQAYSVTMQGYKSGAYSLLEVLDSQRTIMELEMNYYEVARDYHDTIFEIEKLIGRSLSDLNEEE